MTPQKSRDIYEKVQIIANWTEKQKKDYFKLAEKYKQDSDEGKLDVALKFGHFPETFLQLVEFFVIKPLATYTKKEFQNAYIKNTDNYSYRGLHYITKFNKFKVSGSVESFVKYLQSDEYMEDVFRAHYMVKNFSAYQQLFDSKKLKNNIGVSSEEIWKPKPITM